jgi:hypothetical protein
MDIIEKTFSKPERNSEAMSSFGFRLKNQFTSNEAHRRAKELEWIESLRQIKGLYDPDVKIEQGNSKVYPKITRSKINIVLSRLHEMLFPDNDKNWEVQPTPEPSIDQSVVMQIAMSLVKTDENGQQIIPTPQELRVAIDKFCDETCENMSRVIDDQLVEMDYAGETKEVLRSGLMYGTGIMKGPMINKRIKRRWEPSGKGEFVEKATDEDIPLYKRVRVWDWYPDMTTTDLDKIEGSFERHVFTKHDLRDLLKRQDFYADEIKKYMDEHPSGDYVAKNWEVDLQVIEVEAGAGKNYRTLSSSAVSDEANRSTIRQLGKKYQVLEYWGYVDGSDLEACGVKVDDVSLEYAANVWLLGNVPIKAVLYEGALNTYKVFYYEKDETSIFGEGLARVMRHSQLAIAAGARMVLDNGAVVAGPQMEINVSLLSPDTDLNSFYARKLWFREGRGIDSQYPAIRPIMFDSHIPELLTIIDAFKQFGDEETTLPTWMIGQMVNNETAQATSGRMATITISIKDVVKNFDSFTEKIIADLYAWNMEFNPRQDIKGDFRCRPRGVSSLVMKEIRMQALTQLSTTMTPEEWVYIDRREFLKEKLKAHDINIELRSEDEAAAIRQEEQNSIQMQLALEMQKAEIAYKKSQTLAQLTKAKDKNVEAQIKAQTPIEQPQGTDPRVTDEEVALAQTDRMGKEAEIRRGEERHMMEMAHATEDHSVKKAVDTTKAAQEIAITGRKSESEMEMKKKEHEHKLKQQKQDSKKGDK